MGEPDVDLCVNCYQRTCRAVLCEGFFARVIAGQAHRFARRTVIINNVEDRSEIEHRAGRLRDAGELDAWFFVEDCIEEALSVTELSRADLGRAPYFTDWGLVLATLSGPDWVTHIDPEVVMSRPLDWITPAIDLMEGDSRIMVANPSWYAPTPQHDTLPRETLEDAGDFALGLGFSDQVFLARRSELAAPIYKQRCVATRRYPMVAIAPSFEARVDAWMRHHNRLRATCRSAEYRHPDDIGDAYPLRTPSEKLRYVVNQAVLGAVRGLPLKRRCWRGI